MSKILSASAHIDAPELVAYVDTTSYEALLPLGVLAYQIELHEHSNGAYEVKPDSPVEFYGPNKVIKVRPEKTQYTSLRIEVVSK